MSSVETVGAAVGPSASSQETAVAKERQITPRAVVLAVVLAAVMGAANAYLGLFAGMTIASAIPSAVVSMAVLKLLGHGGILENNIVQTGGSVGPATAAGVIFTTPALVMLGAWHGYPYGWIFGFVALGGMLGVLFSVPLRRVLIVELQLPFPEGTAAAEVLRAGADGTGGARTLSLAAGVGAIVKLLASNGLRLIPNAAVAAGYFGRSLAYVSASLSPALLGVGYICGPNVGIVMLAGGILSWHIALPLYTHYFIHGNALLAAKVSTLSAASAAGVIWSQQIRFMGVGAMLVGGLWTLISLRGTLLKSIRSGFAAARYSSLGAASDTDRDLPMQYILIGVALITVPLSLMYHSVVGSFAVSIPMTLAMIVLAFVFCSVAGYMAGLVGTSNDPVSGMIIATVLAASVMLLALTHGNAVLGPIGAVMIGAAVCCAVAMSGDNVQDLKCGQLVGATPWRQQLMLCVGVVSSALVLAPVLNLLNRAYGIGVPDSSHSHPLSAPQATMIAAVSRVMFGGELPWMSVGIGGLIALATILIDEILRTRGRGRAPVLAVAVGIYLPLELTASIFIGSLLAWFVARRVAGGQGAAGSGVLFAAGMIAGESLTGIIMAVPIVLSGRADILALPQSLRLDESLSGKVLGLLLYAALGWLLYRVASRGGRPATASSGPLG